MGSPSNLISVDGEHDQPAAKNITYMDVDLYKAAARGDIGKFDRYQESELVSLRTPSLNTVLHVYLASNDTRDRLVSRYKFGPTISTSLGLYYIFGSCSRFLGCTFPLFCFEPTLFFLELLATLEFRKNWKLKTSFIEQILNKCPSLLLQPNAKGQTPLHVAARYGHSAFFKFLINYREKAPYGDIEKQDIELKVREMIRKPDLESNTVLHLAVQYGHLLVVEELLKFEDPNFSYSANKNEETPLYIAARRGYLSLLPMILDKIKSEAHCGPYNRTALHAAAMAGDAEATRKILHKKQDFSLTKETDENGQNPLHYAAHLGHYSVVKELLEWDKSAAYVADKKREMTPLLMAARQGHGRIVKKIISSCPDCCEMKDKRGWNLLHYVSIRGLPYELRHFVVDDSETETITPYASIRDLKDEKDALGITPRQVFFACRSVRKMEPASVENYQRSKEKEESEEGSSYLNNSLEGNINTVESGITIKPPQTQEEQIENLLKDIVKEEVADVPVRRIGDRTVWLNSIIEKAKEAHLVVAALIATVTFAAAITVPGGYKSDASNSDAGTPFLIRDMAFKAFVISNALAFILSLAAVALHFQMVSSSSKRSRFLFLYAAKYIDCAVWAIVIAFGTGTYVILQPSPALAIASCCIGVSTTFFVLLPHYNYFSEK